MYLQFEPNYKSIIMKQQLTTAGFAKVEPHQLHHVGLEQIDVPPGPGLGGGQGAGAGRVHLGTAAVHGQLRDAAVSSAGLHRRLARCDIQHCNIEDNVSFYDSGREDNLFFFLFFLQ